MNRICFRRLLLMCAVTSLACSDGTSGPELDPFSLFLTGPLSERPHHTKPGNIWLVTCSPVLTIQPTGGVGVAEFGTAVARWSGAFDGSFGSQTLSVEQVVQIWGQPTVAANERITRRFEIGASASFEFTVSFKYTVDGVPGSADHTMLCAPPAPPPSGRWALESINGQSVPATPLTGVEVRYDTLTFSPNLTYRTKSERFGGTPPRSFPEDLSENRLEVRSPTTLFLPRLSQTGAGVAIWAHPTPTFTFTASGGDVYLYRQIGP